MSRRRGGSPSDPTGWLGSRERIFGDVAHAIGERRIAALALYAIEGWSYRAIAEHLSISRQKARELIESSVSMLRHPSTYRDFNKFFVDDGTGLPSFSGELVDLVPVLDELLARLVPLATYKPCEYCGDESLPPAGSYRGGRPPRYCSNACRQAAYRARHRTSVSTSSGIRSAESDGSQEQLMS